MRIDLPMEVKEILSEINNAGYEAYIVGGCVRDFLLGKEPNDWDITTSAKPEEVKKIFRRTVDTGLQHGTVTVLKNGQGYEVTTYRIDGEYLDGRHPKEVIFTGNLKQDLMRRDFTINAMAYHPQLGLVDEFGGLADLENKIIRCVGSAKERFGEDALRMMRAIRFAAQLGYEIEEETKAAIGEMAGNLGMVSAERIQVELTKLLVSDHPELFRLFYETGLTKVFLPEFDATMETPQNNPFHCYSVGEHILHSLTGIPPMKHLRLTMLLHDIAKPACRTTDETGRDRFLGHQEKGRDMAKEILKRLKFDNDTITKVAGLIESHDYKIEPNEKAMRRALHRIGEEFFPDLFLVKEADISAKNPALQEEKRAALSEVQKVYEAVLEKQQCVNLKTLAVSGKDLIAAGFTPGKEIGDILQKMLAEVLEEPSHNDKDYLLTRFLRKEE